MRQIRRRRGQGNRRVGGLRDGRGIPPRSLARTPSLCALRGQSSADRRRRVSTSDEASAYVIIDKICILYLAVSLSPPGAILAVGGSCRFFPTKGQARLTVFWTESTWTKGISRAGSTWQRGSIESLGPRVEIDRGLMRGEYSRRRELLRCSKLADRAVVAVLPRSWVFYQVTGAEPTDPSAGEVIRVVFFVGPIAR